MKFTRGEYQRAPEWLLETSRWKLDVDWNVRFRFPFGASIGAYSTRKSGPKDYAVWSWCLDVNPPLGEPNRLYLHGWGWRVILGLLSMRKMRVTKQLGDRTFNVEYYLGWPHIDGCARSDPPRRGEWDWLTIHRD